MHTIHILHMLTWVHQHQANKVNDCADTVSTTNNKPTQHWPRQR